MGKINILTSHQKIFLSEFSKNQFLTDNFYFSGGTALSVHYLQHRYSDDLDFFAFKPFDTQTLFLILSKWAEKYQFSFTVKMVSEMVYRYFLKFKSGAELKVDFCVQANKQLAREKVVGGIRVDSLLDLAANKTLSIIQRLEAKDFVDVYFLLKKFSFWRLRDAVAVKFHVDNDPWLYAADFMKVEHVENMPRMIKKLTLAELRRFFVEQAQKIGKKVIA